MRTPGCRCTLFFLVRRLLACHNTGSMIRQLTLEGITLFPSAQCFSFEPGINVLIGGNDSGKSHLMKLGYALCKWSSGSTRKELPAVWAEEKRLRLILMRVFGLRDLTELTSRFAAPCTATVHASMVGEKVPPGSAELVFSFRSGAEEEGLHISTMPERYLNSNSIYLAAREVLSVYPCYTQIGRRYPELLDSAGWDLCTALEQEPTAEPEHALLPIIRRIEALLRGRMLRRHDRFYLHRPGQEPTELNLVAEGFKRIGTLGLLLANGSVRRGTTLFWDEPEMNLNTSHLPALVDILLALCHAGVQLVLSTHSLFLLRELAIRLSEAKHRALSRRYFGLQPGEHGTTVCAADELEALDRLDSLDAEAAQADRYLRMEQP